mgnify:CR=1 FL=1
MSSKVIIIDYGMGNLGSVKNMLKRVGADSEVSGDLEVINKADKILLPGVGAFDAAINTLKEKGLIAVLKKRALEDKIPFLGICLGMQLLTDGSEEGVLPGLSLIPGNTLKFDIEKLEGKKIPHMGWNTVYKGEGSPLTKDMDENERFYFVHSYYVKVSDSKHSILKTNYGNEFDSGIQRNNIMGVQFHPEKSHKFGMKLLKNFANI